MFIEKFNLHVVLNQGWASEAVCCVFGVWIYLEVLITLRLIGRLAQCG